MNTATALAWPVRRVPLPRAADRYLVTLTLDGEGAILECEGDVEAMFGYAPEVLISCHVSTLLPWLGGIELMQQGRVNSLLDYLCRIGMTFRARRRDDEYYQSLVSLANLGDAKQQRLRMFIRPC